MKTIATTGSIVLTTVLNAAFLSGPFTMAIWAGALVVVVSVFNCAARAASNRMSPHATHVLTPLHAPPRQTTIMVTPDELGGQRRGERTRDVNRVVRGLPKARARRGERSRLRHSAGWLAG
jgi:hypothetical protein